MNLWNRAAKNKKKGKKTDRQKKNKTKQNIRRNKLLLDNNICYEYVEFRAKKSYFVNRLFVVHMIMMSSISIVKRYIVAEYYKNK